jgi:hypothetical protein
MTLQHVIRTTRSLELDERERTRAPPAFADLAESKSSDGHTTGTWAIGLRFIGILSTPRVRYLGVWIRGDLVRSSAMIAKTAVP